MLQRAVCIQLRNLCPRARPSVHVICHNLNRPVVVLLPAAYLFPTTRKQLLDRSVCAIARRLLEPAQMVRYEMSMGKALDLRRRRWGSDIPVLTRGTLNNNDALLVASFRELMCRAVTAIVGGACHGH